MQIIFQQLFVLYVFLLFGWFFGKWKPQMRDHTGLLSLLLVNLFLPCKVFTSFSKNFTASYLSQHRYTLLISLALLCTLAVSSHFAAKAFSKDRQLRKVYSYTFTISNYAYVGYALAEGVFGSLVLTDLIMFCFPFIIFANSMGYMMFTGDRMSAKRLFNPVTVAIVLGAVFGLLGIRIPSLLQPVLSIASSCMAPLSMIMIGVVLSAFSLRYLVGNLSDYVAVFLRLMVIPALVLGAFLLLDARQTLIPAVLMACMPCPINPILLSRMTNRNCDVAARIVLLSNALSCVTLPLWLWILQQL